MNILILIPDFGKGGAERVFSQLGNELAKRHRVIDCVFNRELKREYDSRNETVDLNVPAGKNLLSKFFFFFLRVYRLKRIKKKFAIDLTISHLEGADYVNVLSQCRDQMILCVHGTKIHDKNIKGILGWFRLNVLIPGLYSRAAHIVTVSRAIRHELVTVFRLPDEKVTVIHNFFDVEAIQEKAKGSLPMEYESLMKNNDVIITCGRLTHEKNQSLLIDIMPALLAEHPRVKLIIMGSGQLGDFLVGRAQKLGLRVQVDNQRFSSDNQIFFVGFCANPFAYFSRSKIFLLPSLWEGFPLVLCEALICQTPVIAHDCPTGPREIVAPLLEPGEVLNDVSCKDHGVLIPFSYENKSHVKKVWTDTVVKVLEDECLRDLMAKSGKERVTAFDKRFIVHEWYTLVEKFDGTSNRAT